ncbi:MAG: ParA family protein [Geminicoccaceae bacterium]
MSSASPSRPEARARILAVANQKGGVGKTTTAINLGTALAAAGHPTLLLDLDPQGNASTGLGIDRASRSASAYDVLLRGRTIDEVVVSTEIAGLDLVPATVDLAAAEVELVGDAQRPFRLREAFSRLSRSYAYILIDCPPSLGLLTVNALAAAHGVLVPLQCEFFALEGLSQLLKTIERVRRGFNPMLQIHGVVLTMFDKRNNLSEQVATDVRSFLGDRVYDTVIPRNVRISEAPSHGKPVLLYDHRCPGAVAYAHLAGEMLRRDRRLAAA